MTAIKGYTPEAMALFARYAEHRSAYSPLECNAATTPCWVRDGPPAISSNGNRNSTRCTGCGGAPRIPYPARRPR